MRCCPGCGETRSEGDFECQACGHPYPEDRYEFRIDPDTGEPQMRLVEDNDEEHDNDDT